MSEDLGQNNQGGNRNGRRRRRRRSGQGEGPQEGSRPVSNMDNRNGNGNGNGNRRRRRRPQTGRPEGGGGGGGGGRGGGGGGSRRPRRAIQPFDIFAAYHLGLSENKRFRPAGVREVANRFGCGQNDLLSILTLYSMDSQSLAKLRGKFEVSWARQDIKTVPEGMDREAIARDRYQDFIDVALEVGLFEEEPTIELMQAQIDEASAQESQAREASRARDRARHAEDESEEDAEEVIDAVEEDHDDEDHDDHEEEDEDEEDEEDED